MRPPFSFWSCPKRECAAPGGREKGAKRAPVQWPSARRGSADRCLLRFGLAFGHARVFCEVDTAVPWRMVPTSSGCKDAFDQLLFYCLALRRSQYFRHQCSTGSSFRAFRFATRCPDERKDLLRCPMLKPSSTTGQRQRKEKQLYPKLPQAGGLPKGWAFPSLTAASDSQPSPAGGRRSAPAQTDPPNIFSFPPGAAHFLFDVSKRKWGVQWTGYHHSRIPRAAACRPLQGVLLRRKYHV